MDLGQDAALSTTYHNEHLSSCTALATVSAARTLLSALKRAPLLKMSLAELKQAGVTPSAMAASGASWSQLCKAYGADALLAAGFTWPHMRACGITGEQACAIGMDALNVDANELMEVRPSVASVAAMQMPLSELKRRGFTMEMLLALGLTSKTMRAFGYPVAEWAHTYDCDWQKLGFVDYTTCERHGWLREDLYSASVFGAPDARAAPVVKITSGRLDF